MAWRHCAVVCIWCGPRPPGQSRPWHQPWVSRCFSGWRPSWLPYTRRARTRCRGGRGASMPFLLRALILWLHLLAAITWIGGLVFQMLVVFPTLARAAPTRERMRLALSLEARFRVIMWPAVGVVLFT